MKKLLALLASAATACQQHSGPASAVDTKPAAFSKAVAVSQRAARPALSAPAAPVNAVSADFLRRYDLTRVLQLQQEAGTTNPPMAINGFYGPDNYRMELVLTSVRRAAEHPSRYLVQGKDRYKKSITPLSGYIDFTEARLAANNAYGNPNAPILYTVLGTYELREDPHVPGAGIFRGRIAADMLIEQGQALFMLNSDTPAESGGVTYSGTWTSLATGQRKAATWVANIFEYQGAQVASDFIIGGRERGINPKYAKAGWNHLWENDEWWVESPGAVASRK